MNNLELIWTLIDLGQAGEPHRVLGYAQGPLATRREADVQGQAALRQHLPRRASQVDPVLFL